MVVQETLQRRGEYRRAILLRSFPGRVEGELEDNFHHFFATVLHDGSVVQKAEGHGERFPYSTCGAASAQIALLEGISLSEDLRKVYDFTNVREQCTHTVQLAGHAIAHAARAPTLRLYEIRIRDHGDGTSTATLHRDGELAVEWVLRGDVILSPEAISGKTTTVVAEEMMNIQFETGELATMLRRGVWQFLAQQRVSHLQHKVAANLRTNGVCYTYQPSRAWDAAALDSIRNFEREGIWPLRDKADRIRKTPQSESAG